MFNNSSPHLSIDILRFVSLFQSIARTRSNDLLLSN
nr:MAG TPA: hypothetical protein [Caudoviricetes sp.]